MAPALEAIRVQAVSKIYGRSFALKDIEFTIGQGEFVGLFGQNGAGKSTILRIAAALIRPTSGQVRVFGGDLWRDLSLRTRVGFLSHAIGLYPNLTVRENLLFFARLGGTHDEPGRRVDEIVERLDLGRYAGAEVRHLSRGWQQRAAIARGLLSDPNLLLWDEPFSGLDEKTTSRMSEILGEFRRDGRTALISSHDFERTMKICSRAILIDRGRLVFDGVGEEAADAYRRIMGVA